MAGAWEKYQQTYADLKFADRAGGGVIRRMLMMLNKKLSMAFEKSQFTAPEMDRKQCMMPSTVPSTYSTYRRALSVTLGVINL